MIPASKTKARIFDKSFAPAEIEDAVKSIYELDNQLMGSSSEDDTNEILPHVLKLLHTTKGSSSYLIRPVTLLRSLVSKNRFSAALLVASDVQALAACKNGMIEEFLKDSVKVFLKLGKVNQAFGLLAQVETYLDGL